MTEILGLDQSLEIVMGGRGMNGIVFPLVILFLVVTLAVDSSVFSVEKDGVYMRKPSVRNWSDKTYAMAVMFGKESAGIPEEILLDYEDQCFRIPMNPQIRSLNLSNSVAIVLYEALRQNHFASMQLNGELHRLHWNHPNE